jgi:hypothetical protein
VSSEYLSLQREMHATTITLKNIKTQCKQKIHIAIDSTIDIPFHQDHVYPKLSTGSPVRPFDL